MPLPRTFGIVGALLLIVGVLLPIGVSPIHGATTLFSNPISVAGGVILVVVSLASIVFSLVGKEQKLLTTAMVAIFLIATSFLSFTGQISKAHDDPRVAAQLVGIELGLGWLVMALGALGLLIAAVLARRNGRVKEEG
jgi:uncharacterized membrane protein YfcA